MDSVARSGERPRARRLVVLVLLLLFLAATVVTTAVSLGRYCLTTDSPDLRALPGSDASDARR